MLAKELLEKYNAGKTTVEENRTVESWFDQCIINSPEIIVSDRRLYTIQKELPWSTVEKRRNISIRWIAAAAVLLVSSIAVMLAIFQSPDFDPNAPVYSNRAKIILSNGEEVALQPEMSAEEIALLESKGLVVSNNGLIRLSEILDKGNVPSSGYTKIETPKGGEYKILLPDGSLVQLNAMSYIEFPNEFENNERRVSIYGEAYFEVSKDTKRPFLINVADKMGIKVLGTTFNVSAYEYNKSITATLLEGSVEVCDLKNNVAKKVRIIPGQTASLMAGKDIQVDTRNIEQVFAWKDGVFNFNNCSLSEAAQQLEQWYNIRIEMEPYVAHQKLYGEFERKQPLSNVMKLLENIGYVVELKGTVLKIKG